MTRVYVADAKSEERSALRLMLLDLKMEVVGEAADWQRGHYPHQPSGRPSASRTLCRRRCVYQ